jgi:hypothetical protein
MPGGLRTPRTPRDRALFGGAMALLLGTLAWTGTHHRTAADVAGKPLKQFQATGFSVDLPCKPKPIKQSQKTAAGPVSLVAYVCAGGTDLFTISSTSLPPSSGKDFDLTAAANEAGKELGGTTTGVNTSTYLGHPAVDFRVPDATKGSQKATLFGRAVYTGSNLYEMQYLKSGHNVTSPPPNYEAFLNSLHID